MKKNKILTALLAAVLLTSTFASCGSDDSSKDESATSGVTSEAVSEATSETVSEAASEATSETVSEAASEQISEEVSEEEEVFTPYAEDKSGYLSNEKTMDLNFNSITIKAKDFTGTFRDTMIDENGRLTMTHDDEKFFAMYESDIIDVGTFDTMLISWNAVAGDGKMTTLVSFECEDGTWSDLFSFGTWSDKNNTSTSKSVENEFGKMNVDTLLPAKKTTGKIKVRITFNRSKIYRPVVENITIATSTMKEIPTLEYPEKHINDVPIRSQIAPENGSDGGVMCSATTAAMALEYMGTNQSTYDTAMGTYDKEFGGYGNWLFSVAEPAAHGYYTFCDFYTRDMIKYALSKGYAIGCSTYLSSVGHIVLVVGYETINGVDYYVVNDPYIDPAKLEVTRYECDYFDSVWIKEEYNNTGVVYVYQGKY